MIVHGEGDVLVPAHLNFGKFMLDRLRKVKANEPCLYNCTSGVKLTYGEFTQHAVSVSAALTALGVARGDTVAVAGEPRATFIPTTLAVMMTGAAYTPIEIDCGRAVLVHKLNLTKPKYIIYSRLFWKAYSDVLKELDFIKTFICFDDIDDIKLSVATMATRHVDVTTFEPAVVRGETDVATMATRHVDVTTFEPAVVRGETDVATMATRHVDVTTFEPAVVRGETDVATMATRHVDVTTFEPAVVRGETDVATMATRHVDVTTFEPAVVRGEKDVATMATRHVDVTTFEPAVVRGETDVATMATRHVDVTTFEPAVVRGETDVATMATRHVDVTTFEPAVVRGETDVATMATRHVDVTTFEPAVVRGETDVATMATRHVDVTTFEPAVVSGETDVAMIVYSSGTTGMSKGVLLTHLNCIARTNFTWYHDAGSMQTCFIIGEIWSTYVIFLIFYFISAGKKLIYTENKAAELNIVQDYQVDTMPTVPMGIHEMVAAADEHDLRALKVIYCAAGHLSPPLAKALKQRYPHIKLFRLYGATEADVMTVQRPSNMECNNVGIAVPGMTIKVVDVQTRATLGPNQRGEICVRGPCLMKGYLGATSPYLDEEGFYPTGDLSYYDDLKQFYLVDRLKDIINYEGAKVCPAEVEAVLLRHPAVLEAAVLGKPVGTVSELPVAFVVLHPGAQVTENDLIDYVNNEVSWYMQLRGGVRFLSELPRSSLQKIQRRRLREILELEETGHSINTQ